MLKIALITITLLIGGCTVTVKDERASRAELVAAFKERDDVIFKLAQAVETLQRQNVQVSKKEIKK